jgi:hypothetical protein
LSREVYVSRLADNALDVLRGKRKRPKYDSLLSTTEVANLALERWVRPRALRDQSYRAVKREDTLGRILGKPVAAIPGQSARKIRA